MNEPGLLLADEPTGNLDSTNGGAILDPLLRPRDALARRSLWLPRCSNIAARCGRLICLTDGALAEDLDVTTGEDPGTTLARVT